MILDAFTKLMSAQALTGSDEVSASAYDCGDVTPKRRIGTGERLSVVFQVTTAAAGDSASFAGDFEFRVIHDTQVSLATATVIVSRPVAGADLSIGAIVEVPIPAGTPTKRFLGAQALIGAGDTVSCSAWIIPSDSVQEFTAYAKGYVV